MVTFIVVVLILLALGAIGVVVIRKLPQLSSLHIQASSQEKLKRLKKDIVVARILRRISNTKKKIVTPENWQRVMYLVKDAYAKLKVLEDKYKVHTAEAKVTLLLKRGLVNIIDDPEVAEQCFLDVITLDAHNLGAYEGLSRIYLSKKQFHEAIEILEFLVKLNPASAGRYFFDLSEAIYGSGDIAQAWHYAEEAVRVEPSNPKYLDFSVELAILGEHGREGAQYLKHLSEVNPGNAKLEEFRTRLNALKNKA